MRFASRLHASGSPFGPRNDVTVFDYADARATGLGGKAVRHCSQECSRLREPKAETKHEYARIALLNPVYEIIQFFGAEGMADNRHLAV
jgi:hypothetical protein